MPDEPGRGPSVQWAVQRPDGLVFPQESEADARGWVEAGNADGSGRYRLLMRPLPVWEDVTVTVTAPASTSVTETGTS